MGAEPVNVHHQVLRKLSKSMSSMNFSNLIRLSIRNSGPSEAAQRFSHLLGLLRQRLG